MKIKVGTTRICLLIGEYAIKIPYFKRWDLFLKGLIASMDENQYRGYRPDYYAQVKWMSIGGFFLIMERCSELVESEYDEQLFKIRFPNEDIKIENFGKNKNGDIVVLDYASSKYHCSGCEFKREKL